MRCKRGAVIIVLSLMVGLGFGWVGAGAEGAVANGPSAVVQGADYNFGSVPAGKDILHDFVIKNTGNQTLKIESVKTS